MTSSLGNSVQELSRLGLGGEVARGPGESGQGRRGGVCGRRKELGCGLRYGSVACLTVALARESSGGDLAAAWARAKQDEGQQGYGGG